MSQQDQVNADVALLSDALTGIGQELQDLKASLAAQAPQLDLSNLDAIAQKALSLAPQAQSAPADAPANVDTTTLGDAPATDAPADVPAQPDNVVGQPPADPAADSGVNPPPTV